MKNKKLTVNNKEIKECCTISVKCNPKNNFDFTKTNFSDDLHEESIDAIIFDDGTLEGIIKDDYCVFSFVYGKIIPNGVLSYVKINEENSPIISNTLIKKDNYYGIIAQVKRNTNNFLEELNSNTSRYIKVDVKTIKDKKTKLMKIKDILKLKEKLFEFDKVKSEYDCLKQNFDYLMVTGLLELKERLNTRFSVAINSALTTINQKDFDSTDFMYRELLVNSDIWIPIRDELEFNFLSYLSSELELDDIQKQKVKTLLKK